MLEQTNAPSFESTYEPTDEFTYRATLEPTYELSYNQRYRPTYGNQTVFFMIAFSFYRQCLAQHINMLQLLVPQTNRF